MSNVDVLFGTQRIIVKAPASISVIEVHKRTQKIIVKPPPSIRVVKSGPVGPTGFTGPPGAQGPQGLPGQDAIPSTAYSFPYDQGSPSDEWHIVHNLGYHPAVSVVDSGGTEVEEDHVQHVSNNELIIFFTLPFGGKAFLS